MSHQSDLDLNEFTILGWSLCVLKLMWVTFSDGLQNLVKTCPCHGVIDYVMRIKSCKNVSVPRVNRLRNVKKSGKNVSVPRANRFGDANKIV